ncbi:MAG: hypothetical protein SFU56_08270 [Capsulimonadales bacterium]|nr:hypothetical protein [Capsulimonadales bacterium]
MNSGKDIAGTARCLPGSTLIGRTRLRATHRRKSHTTDEYTRPKHGNGK